MLVVQTGEELLLVAILTHIRATSKRYFCEGMAQGCEGSELSGEQDREHGGNNERVHINKGTVLNKK